MIALASMHALRWRPELTGQFACKQGWHRCHFQQPFQRCAKSAVMSKPCKLLFQCDVEMLASSVYMFVMNYGHY